MTTTWRFDSLEFLTLWERATGDWLPAPFLYTSRTRMHYDHMRERFEAAQRLHDRDDRSFANALDTIALPDIRINVSGTIGSSAESEGAVRIRLMGLRREGRGYIVRQHPASIDSGAGDFTVTECDPLALADELVALLPESEPGRLPDIPLELSSRSDTTDEDYGRSLVDDIFEEPASLRSQRFFEARATCQGGVQVVQGSSKYGPRGLTPHRLAWRDLQDDGRYIFANEPPLAVGADRKRMVSAINLRVASVIRVIKDERAGAYS